jgi:N-acetylglucosamine-6-phosphate deacetylase
MQLLARRYDNQQTVAVTIAADRLASIEPAEANGADLPWLAPGFVDLQINGYGGQEFNDFELDVEKVAGLSRAIDSHGVTRYCPTATTQSFELLQHAFQTIDAACQQDPAVAARVACIHLEGPFLSRQDGPRGAHPLEHCRPPDWDEFQRLQEAAAGRIGILTISPEYDNAADVIRRVAESGVVVAIGHTSASSDQIRAAVDAGASMSTHLGNGAHGEIRRHPNYIWDQLAEDGLVASLIVDGHHLPRSVVKSFIRAKQLERCVLVSDITGMAGMPPGLYENSNLGSVEVLEDGRLVIPGQRQLLAGAALPIGVGVARVMEFAGLSLAEAVTMASSRPARLIGLEPVELEEGAVADLVLFQLEAGELHVQATILAGQLVYGELPFNSHQTDMTDDND